MAKKRATPLKSIVAIKNYKSLQGEDRFTANAGNAFLDRLRATLAMPGIQALSLDFFDTIVWRPYRQPVDIFWVLGQKLLDENVLSEDFVPSKFMQARILAEARARQRKIRAGLFREVTLTEIYDEFVALSAEDRLRAIELEVAHEAEWTMPDPFICQAIASARDLGKQILIISNTYFSREQIYRLVQGKTPYNFPIEDIHCSSHYNIDKEAGLVSLVLLERGLAPASVLHVGDNRGADVDMPGRAGVTTLFYSKFSDLFPETVTREEKIRAFGNCTEEPQIDLLPQLRRLHLNEMGYEGAFAVSEQIGFFIVGPTLAAYARWVLDEVRRQGPAPVLCLTREGLLLSEVFQSVAAQIGQRGFISLPFLSSRSILYSGCFFDFSEEELETFLLSRRTPFTVQTFCKLVGATAISGADFGIDGEYLDFPLIAGSELTFTLIAAMSHHKVLKQTSLDYAAARREMFKRYVDAVFARHGVGCGNKVLYVADVGWSGRSQRMLERILCAIGHEVELRGLYMATDTSSLAEHMMGLKAKGWLYDGGAPLRSSSLGLQSKEIIEQVCSSHLGAVSRYDDEGNPVFGSESKNLLQRNDLRKLRNAARSAVIRHGANFEMLRSVGLERHLVDPESYRNAYAGLIAFPSAGEYDLFSGWAHEENNLSDNVEALSSPYWKTFAAYASPQQFLEAHAYWKLPEFQRIRPGLVDSLLLKMAGLHSFVAETGHPYSVAIDSGNKSSREEKTAYFSADGRAVMPAVSVCETECSFSFRNEGTRAFEVEAVLHCVHDTRERARHEKVFLPDFAQYPEIGASGSYIPPGATITVKVLDPSKIIVPVSIILCVRFT